MIHTEHGLKIDKNEIAALLAFASQEPQNTKLYGVSFRCSDTGVRARATNGHIALDATGENDGGDPGEWFVHRDFLRGALRVLENGYVLRLQFAGASLRDAAVINADGVECSVYSWPEDAANSQLSFPEENAWDKILVPPDGKRSVKFVTVNAEYLGLLAKITKAAGAIGIDCYPPPKSGDHCVFRATGESTNWIAVIMPMHSGADQSVDGAADDFDAEEPDFTEAKGRKRK